MEFLEGLLPFIAAAVSVATGNIYAGLWYPIIIALVTFCHRYAFCPGDQGSGHSGLEKKNILGCRRSRRCASEIRFRLFTSTRDPLTCPAVGVRRVPPELLPLLTPLFRKKLGGGEFCRTTLWVQFV